ncbi:MAG: type II CRISPR-associated endonuclease Cas1 [Bacteroidetes bacterium]|nr:MAG: type II CRISPR-associated endonuclease Cas1 [Bacteroidota bacterium]
MIKRTLFFANPVYLSTQNKQLVATYPSDEKEKIPRAKQLKEIKPDNKKTVPIEDIGVIILEHPQITVTNKLLEQLNLHNVAVIHCDSRHMPVGLIMPLNGHSELSERFRHQINASLPLKKNLWQQTVQAKIINQAGVLRERGIAVENMYHWAKQVTSGDKLNHEARAASYYWQNIFDNREFSRARFGEPPNNLLNYGYAILRSIAARALVSSGLLPALGIFHQNKYNAYCLADDIMEPYRPYVDVIVSHIVDNGEDCSELTTEIKLQLASIAAMDVIIDGKKSPLMVAMSRTTNSLFECFAGISRKLLYPRYE